MHPRPQPLPNLHQIPPNPLRLHTHQHARFPRRLHDPLTPRFPHLIIRRERIRDEFLLPHAPKERFEHEGVFDRLAGALALERGGGVRGVAHHGYVGGGVCSGWEIVTHGPEGEVGDVEEADESVGFGAPACEEAIEIGVGGGEDPFVVVPGWVLDVCGYDVEGFAVVDGVAEDGFAWKGFAVSAVTEEWIKRVGMSTYLVHTKTLSSVRILRPVSPRPCPWAQVLCKRQSPRRRNELPCRALRG